MNKLRRNKIVNIKAILILLFVLIITISCNKSSIEPKIGNVYLIKQNDTYTTWLITDFKDNKVYFIANDYIVSSKDKIFSIDKPESYTDLSLSITINSFNNIEDKTLIKSPKK